MQIVITQTPSENDRALYERVLAKLFPTKPLWFFLAVAAGLTATLAVRYFNAPSESTLLYICVALLCMALAGGVLFATKKNLPPVRERLAASFGQTLTYTLTDELFAVENEAGARTEYPIRKLAVQYCSNRAYVFCFADGARMAPQILIPTPENLSSLNTFVKSNAKKGCKIKRINL